MQDWLRCLPSEFQSAGRLPADRSVRIHATHYPCRGSFLPGLPPQHLHPAPTEHPSLTVMQVLANTARASALRSSVRSFASSAARCQATPLEKPVLNKEFKIYRWVSADMMYRNEWS